MTVAQAAVLGALQGATEFLPVSSSGHLVIAQHAMGLIESQMLFDVCVHGGTLASLLVFYRAELFRLSHRWMMDLAIATAITGVLGLLLHDHVVALFGQIRFVGAALLVTGAFLFATRRTKGERTDLGIGRAALVGLAQVVALAPGISRSGTTLAAALLLGLAPIEAVRFAFLLAIPVIPGAIVVEWADSPGNTADPATLGMGMVTAAVVGYWALGATTRVVRASQLHRFAYYLWPMGLCVLLWTTFTR